MRTRPSLLAAGLAILLAAAGVTAPTAAGPADPPPPRIAFLANGRVPADALAAGPVAAQLGAPVFTTEQDALPTTTALALANYDPELVVVMGGPVAISDGVVAAVTEATQLSLVSASPTPDAGVVRAAGGDRFESATIVADLLAAYAPAYLPVHLQAVDADLLDGLDASDLQPMWAHIAPDGNILAQSGGITATAGIGFLSLTFPDSVWDKPIQATLSSMAGRPPGGVGATPCGGAPQGGSCGFANDRNSMLVHMTDTTGDYALLWDVFISVG